MNPVKEQLTLAALIIRAVIAIAMIYLGFQLLMGG